MVPSLRFQWVLHISPLELCRDLDVVGWAFVLLWCGCMINVCLCWSVDLGVIVVLWLGKLWGSKFAVSTIVTNSLFRTFSRSGCVGLGMCFAMVWLYDQCLFVLECWFGCDRCFVVGEVMGFQVGGLNNCGQFPL